MNETHPTAIRRSVGVDFCDKLAATIVLPLEGCGRSMSGPKRNVGLAIRITPTKLITRQPYVERSEGG